MIQPNYKFLTEIDQSKIQLILNTGFLEFQINKKYYTGSGLYWSVWIIQSKSRHKNFRENRTNIKIMQKKILVLHYYPGAGGKFVLNCLGHNKGFAIGDSTTADAMLD